MGTENQPEVTFTRVLCGLEVDLPLGHKGEDSAQGSLASGSLRKLSSGESAGPLSHKSPLPE